MNRREAAAKKTAPGPRSGGLSLRQGRHCVPKVGSRVENMFIRLDEA